MDEPKPKSNTSGGPGTVLRKLYSAVMCDLGISIDTLHDLLNAYLREQKQLGKIQPSKLVNVKGNYLKDLQIDVRKAKAEMTWKTMWKALVILRAYKFDLTIRIYRPFGKTTEHSITCYVKDQPDEERTNDGNIEH